MDRELESDPEIGPGRFRFLPIFLVAVAALAIGLIPLPGLSPAAHRTLVILVVAGGLWMTEALPVPVTALLIPVLGILLGVTDAKGAFAGFGDPIVFLFFGTFLLTEAAAKHGLTDRLARAATSSKWVRARPGRMIWTMAFLGCGISAWVNNTATTAMLLPLALTAVRMGSRPVLVGTLLMAAYAPSLGGLATPVGTAPNLIGLRLLEQATGSRPSFAEWCVRYAPLAILGTLLAAWWLDFRARGLERRAARTMAGDLAVHDDRAADGATRVPGPASPTSGPSPAITPSPTSAPSSTPHLPWSLAERTLIPVFVIVVLLWITPGILAATPLHAAPWVKAWQARLPEPAVPLLGALCLFLLPSGAPDRARILDLGAIRRVDWGTLLLFGGGLSLGALMFDSGLARALGEAIFHAMPISGTFGIVLAATLMAVLVSEVTSNTASASLVVPVVLALAQAAGVDPVKPAIAATIACSFGFMLPVSTPPNALVYGTGRLTIREMVSNGILLDVIGVVLVSVWVTLLG